LYDYGANLNITSKAVNADIKNFYRKQLTKQNSIISSDEKVDELISSNKTLLGVSEKEHNAYIQYRVKKHWSNDRGEVDLVRMANETAGLPFNNTSEIVDNLIASYAASPDLTKKYNALIAANVYMNPASAYYKNMPKQIVMAAVALRNRGLSPDDVSTGGDNAKKVFAQIDDMLKGFNNPSLKALTDEVAKTNEFKQNTHLKYIDSAAQKAFNANKSWTDKHWYPHELVGRNDPALLAFVKDAHKTGYALSGSTDQAEKYTKQTIKNSIAVSSFNGKPDIFLGGLFVKYRADPKFEPKLRSIIHSHINKLASDGLPISLKGETVTYHGDNYKIVVKDVAPNVNTLKVGLIAQDMDYDGRVMIPFPDSVERVGIFTIVGE
jgi:hypothetical protein